MTPALQSIIDNSYQVFEKYKVKVPLDACTACCLTKKQEIDLVYLPVRDIPLELLYDYNTAAKTSKPDIDEFKHFLPRFLELVAEDKSLHHSMELNLSRFRYYEKGEWTDKERDLVQNFGQTFFAQCLMVFPLPCVDRIDAVLIMLSAMKIDMSPILSYWTTAGNVESLLHFSDLNNFGLNGVRRDRLLSTFANEEFSRLVIKWLDEEITQGWFANAIEQVIINPPADLAETTLNELSLTYERLIH